MNNWLGSEARRLFCHRCCTAFSCTGDEACWCTEESVRLPMPRAGDDCLCRDCLRKAADERMDAALDAKSQE